MKNFLIFISGAAAGSITTWLLIKKYYETISDEEIKSVIENFKVSRQEEPKEEEVAEQSDTPSFNVKDLGEYRKINETNYAVPAATEEVHELDDVDLPFYPTDDADDTPFPINPDYFGSSGNDTAIVTYYSKSNVLANEAGIELSVHDILGDDFMSHFGDYEPGTLYMRNNRFGVDYEVILDDRSEIV